MAQRTYSAEARSAQLARHGVVIQFLAVYLALCLRVRAITIRNSTFYFPVMRPDGSSCAAISLTFACVNNIYEIDITVFVRVVVGEVQTAVLLVCQYTGLYYGICRVLVIAFVLIRITRVFVCSVICHISAQRHRTIHVKLRTVTAVRLIRKILRSRAVVLATVFVDRAVGRVTQLVKHSLRVAALHSVVFEID